MTTPWNRHRLVQLFVYVASFCLILLLLVAQGWLWTTWSDPDGNLASNEPLAANGSLGGARAATWARVDQLPQRIALHETVFWEPLDTQSLRKLLEDHPDFINGKSVLEIGTGSGLIALCCRQLGAAQVVATDINPSAVTCARENAKQMALPIDVRLVPSTPAWEQTHTAEYGKSKADLPVDSSAYAVVRANEKFDLIISNPPWEDASPKQWSEYALYDKEFQLLRSILKDGRRYLKPGGRLILVYGCVQAIEVTMQLADQYNYDVFVMDERDPQTLPDVFLPGMMIGLVPKPPIDPHNPKTG